MAVKLHRCSFQFLKIEGHPCWRVEKALIDKGIEYERVPGPARRGKRGFIETLSRQRLYPVIEFEDGSAYREQSKDMAVKIRAGKLFEGRGDGMGAMEPGGG